MKKLPDDLPDCLVFLLGKAYQKAHAYFKKQLKPYGLTNLQHLVLEGLWYRPGISASELGKVLILDKATLSDVLERMDRAGWIEKKVCETDRRLIRIYPSPRADGLKTDLIRKRQLANERILSGFSLEEKLLFKRFLTDVINT